MPRSVRRPLVCDDGVDNDTDGLIDFPDDPECGSPLDPSESVPSVPLTQDQQSCVNEMNKNGAKVNKVQLKEVEKCLKDLQNGKLDTSLEVCTTADPNGKVQKAIDKTESGEEKRCDPLAPARASPFGYTAAVTVNQAAVAGGLGLVHEIFGDPVQDGDLATKTADKETASCQYEMLKQAGKLEGTVMKEVTKAKKTALKDPMVTSGAALEVSLAAVFDPANDKLGKAEGRLVKGVDKKCGSLSVSPATIFPGACANPDLQVVEGCAIAAARCQACSKLNAFDGLGLGCDQLDDASINGSCP